MTAPSAATLLQAWERGQARAPLERALLLLAAGRPGVPHETLARLPLGERDRQLAGLRAELFGDSLDASTVCPACGEPLELRVSLTELWAEVPAPSPDRSVITQDGYELVLRAPNTLDLLAAQSAPAGEARRAIFDECVQITGDDGCRVSAAALPDTLIAEIEQCMEALDPRADLHVGVSCATCAHAWDASVDIASYLWSELDDWAMRVLREVHVLARAYGWREADVLALSANRRQRYLEMAGA